MFHKKLLKRKNELRKRAYSIIMTDRNNDEQKRINQKVYKMNISFDNLHKSMLKLSYSCKNAIGIFSKNINNITRG